MRPSSNDCDSDYEKLNIVSSRYSADPGVFHGFPHFRVCFIGAKFQCCVLSLSMECFFFSSQGFMGNAVNRLEMCVRNQTVENIKNEIKQLG